MKVIYDSLEHPQIRFTITENEFTMWLLANYSRTSMARTPLGPWKSVLAMGSSSQWRLIMAPGREANIANSGKSTDLLHNNCMLSVLIKIALKRQF